MPDHSIVRTRFAPSPSGHLHVGGARTALYCWAYAKKHGGRFVLRIEDTDQKRSSDAAGMAFLEDLRWLGIDWDEGPEFQACGGGEFGPYFQSKRLVTYNKYIGRLLEEGKAYRAFETPDELDRARAAARAAKQNYRYDRASLHLSEDQIRQYLDEGRPHVVRIKVPDDVCISIVDHVRGEMRLEPGGLDDFVIRKADGYPTYHFAVVVDDELMRVTHVIRAQEHLNNTLKHAVLQNALEFRRPEYAHLSVISNLDGSKMSKRDKDKALRAEVKTRELDGAACLDPETWAWWQADADHQLEFDHAIALADELGIELPEINVDDFRRAGYLPEALINYLALLGWNPGNDLERFDADFLVERFDFDRIVKSPAKFDREKLKAFNLDLIQQMSDAAFADGLHAYCAAYRPEFVEAFPGDAFALFAAANKERSKTFADQLPSCRFFITADDDIVYQESKAVRKALVNGEPNGFALLERIHPIIAAADAWTVESVEALIRSFADEHADGKLGKIAQPLRIAVTGVTVSPPIYETLVLLGRDRVARRIVRCLAQRDALMTT